jgi:hypothetical protein
LNFEVTTFENLTDGLKRFYRQKIPHSAPHKEVQESVVQVLPSEIPPVLKGTERYGKSPF